MRTLAVLSVLVVLVLGCRARETEQTAGAVEVKAEPTDNVGVAQAPEPMPKPVAPAPGKPDPKVTYHVPLQGNEPQKGPDDALITIVEFADFDCPFCKARAPTLDQLVEKYGDDLRIIWLNYPLPFHRNARPAAVAALEAHAQRGDEGFWRMHDMLFANQGLLTRDTLEKLAKELGLNMRQFRKALDTDRYAKVIDQQYALGTRLGIPGTPAYYMNGRFMAGFPLETWSYAIDLRISEYRKMAEGGVSKSELYERIIENGKTSP